MTLLLWFTPNRCSRVAIGTIFVLLTIGGNTVDFLTPLWVVASFAVTVCAASAFALVYSIAWIRDGSVTRPLAITCVALSLAAGVGVAVRFPPEMDSNAIELAAVTGVDRTQYAASAAKAVAMALDAPEPKTRIAYAKIAYRMTGQASKYRDESGHTITFVPDADLLHSVGEVKKSEARVRAAIEDYLANGFQREMIKLLALLTFVVSACAAAAIIVQRPRAN